MNETELQRLSVIANIQDAVVKTVAAAAGDDFTIKPLEEIRQDVATAINNRIKQGA